MPDIDNISIKIKASATDANRAIQSLEKNVDKLGKVLGGIKSNNLIQMSFGIKSMGDAMHSFAGVGPKKFDQIATGIDKLAKIDSSNMSKLARGIIPLSASLTTFNSIDPKGVNTLINSIVKLQGSMNNKVNSQQYVELGSAISQMANQVSSAPTIARSITSLMNSIAKVGSVSATNIKATSSLLPSLGQSIDQLAKSLVKTPVVRAEITQLVTGIGSLANAGNKTATTASHLKDLGTSVVDFMKQLQSAPDVSDKTVRLMTALGQLANAGSKTSRMFNAITNAGGGRTVSAFTKLRGAVDRLTSSFKSADTSGASLARTFGKIYANYFLIFRAMKSLWSGVESAMDYVETYNYFNKAFGAVAETTDLSQWKKLGYKSAEAYVSSYEKKASELTTKLTSFNIGNDGRLMETGLASLGMDPNMIMNYQAEFAQMGSAMGSTAENATTLSNVLTEIGLDLASLHNLDYSETLKNMQSGLVGQARVWDKFGTSIRIADMNVYLANHNIGTTVAQLTSADKALLRTTILLDTNRDAWGDLSNTIGQTRNSMRVLKSNISMVGMAIGNLFMPVISAVLPYINGFVIALRRLVNAFGEFLGIEWTGGATGTPSDVLGDIADETENANDAQKKAAKSAKEWKNQLMGFDEINKLDDNSGSNGSGGNDKATSPSSAIQGLFDDMVNEYQKAWDNAYANMENKANTIADKIQKAMVKAWKTGSGKDIGSAIAKWINKGIDYSNNHIDSFNKGLNRVAKILGTGINGFVKELKWDGLGKLIGKGIKGALEAETTFFKTVNWLNLGKNISKSINSFFDTGVLESYGKLLGAKLRAIVDFAFGTITNFKFKKFGKHFGDAINNFLDEMGEVNAKTGLTGWQELGKTLSNSITGILDSINTALDTVKWDKVGKAIADFLGEIEWASILGKVAKLIWKGLGAALKTWIGSLEEDPIGTLVATKIVSVFLSAKFANLILRSACGDTVGGIVLKVVKDGIGKKLGISALQSTSQTVAGNISSSLASELGSSATVNTVGGSMSGMMAKATAGIGTEAGIGIGGAVCIGIATAIVGFKAGNLIYDSLTKDENGDNVIDRFVTRVGDGVKNAIDKKTKPSIKSLGKETKTTKKEVIDATKALNANGDAARFASLTTDKMNTSMGTTSLASYEAYKGVHNLSNAIKNVPTYKGVKFTADVKDVDTATHEASKGIEKAVKLLASKDSKFDSTVDDAKKDETKNVTISGKTNKKFDSIVDAVNSLNNKTLKPTVELTTNKSIKSIAQEWQSNFEKNFKPEWNFTIGNKQGKVTQTINSAWFAPAKALGGVLMGKTWKPIQQYAMGTQNAPAGQYFIAREAGPELVGTIGSHTAVINNKQIVDSVSNGVAVAVANTVAPMISQVIGAINSTSGGDTYIDGRLVTDAILQNAHNRKITNGGKNVFMTI